MKRIVSIAFLLLAISNVLANNDVAAGIAPAKTVYGVASFYSASLDGTKTATGEIFRNNKMTAASNHFKLNTWVRVTNLKNNKSVIVRINDRMHKNMSRKGRVIDLSRSAASKLSFLKGGVTKVKVETVTKGTKS